MTKRENEAFSIKEILQEMLDKNNLQKGIDQISVKETWENVMGNGVVSYTDSVVLKGETLVVKLNSAPLREELSFGKDKIIEMMNRVLKKKLIRKIRLV